jgi:hypothetical protein
MGFKSATIFLDHQKHLLTELEIICACLFRMHAQIVVLSQIFVIKLQNYEKKV